MSLVSLDQRRSLWARTPWVTVVGALLSFALVSCGSAVAHRTTAATGRSAAAASSPPSTVSTSAPVAVGEAVDGTPVQLPPPPSGLEPAKPFVYRTPEGLTVHDLSFTQTANLGSLRPILKSLSVAVVDDAPTAAAIRTGNLSVPQIAGQSSGQAAAPQLMRIGQYQVVYWSSAAVMASPQAPGVSSPAGVPSGDRVYDRYELAGSGSTVIQLHSTGLSGGEVQAFISRINIGNE